MRGGLSPGTAQAQSWDAACTVSESLEYVAIRLHYWLPVVCCPPGSTMGVEECHAPLVTTLADGWHTGCDASTHSGGSRGKRHDSLGVWRRRWRFFPLARVGARVSPAEGKA